MSQGIAKLLVHASFCALLFALLLATGQPLFTDDAWWHLALGRAYSLDGPWLDADPLLFGASGPPAPSSWLADLLLFQLLEHTGFAGLRILHVLTVAGIVGGAWWLLRRASRSAEVASLGTSLFVVLAAYRLFQLRPHLATFVGVLLVYYLLLEKDEAATPLRIALAAFVTAVWANLHAGFVLAPILVAAAIAGILTAGLVGASRSGSNRLVRLSLAFLVIVMAGLVNPLGADAYLVYLGAGEQSPALATVIDEWRALSLFELPARRLPPTPLTWVASWLVIGGCVAAVAMRRESRLSSPTLLALSLASLVALLVAVRFVWLLIFPLLLAAHSLRREKDGALALVQVPTAATALLIVPTFFYFGAWPMLSQALPSRWEDYTRPYPAAKYFGHAIWFLDDAELEGRLFADYALGGFAGFWLAPEMRSMANGTLNLSPASMRAYGALRARQGEREGESFEDLLDRLSIDVFLGTGNPETGPQDQPWVFTTSYLEGVPGWIPVFRNLRCALYLRDHPRNQRNLEKVAAYYEAFGVPFDPVSGFDPGLAFQNAPQWALGRGVVPLDLPNLLARVRREREPERALPQLDRLASIYALLGLYEQVLQVDARIEAMDPEHDGMIRRRIWSLLRLGRAQEAASAAALTEHSQDAFSQWLASVAHSAGNDPDFDPSAALLLPLFSRDEVQRLLFGYFHPGARELP